MTIEEFSNEFDVILNNYYSSKASGVGLSPIELDEYEKSVYLTEAQEEIVKGLYNGKLTGETFETSEEQRRYLDSLVKSYSPTEDPTADKIESNSKVYNLPQDLWFITYETAEITDKSFCNNKNIAEVFPVRQDEYNIIKNNPFRGANKKRVLRIDIGNSKVEIISKYTISSYKIKYLCKPKPIILIALDSDNLSINNETRAMTCSLSSALHRLILQRAAAIAISRIPSNK